MLEKKAYPKKISELGKQTAVDNFVRRLARKQVYYIASLAETL